MKESIFEKQANRSFLSGFLMTLFLFASFSSRSQSIRSLSTQDGLPQSFISGLAQDDSSFIWIATRNGLARYDGIRFKLYQHSSRDTATLASNLIIWLRRDRQNNLWIEYESGELDMMNPVTEKVSHYIKVNTATGPTLSFIRRGWLIDEDGMFWGIVKGAGVIYYDVRTNRSEHFTRQSSGLASDTIRGMAENEGKVWILNDREIRYIEKKSLQTESWSIPYQQDYGQFTGSDAIAIDLHIHKNRELMWGDRKNIYFFNPVSHRFRMVSLPAISYLGIRWIRPGPDGYEYFENYGQIYRYSEQSGVGLIGENFKESVGDVKSFLVDRSGLIWLGTNAKGLRQIDLHTPFFQSRPYKKNFCHDVLDEKLGIHAESMFNWTAKDEEFSQPSYYLRSAYDAHKRFYLALKETICYSDNGKKTFVKLPVIPIIADSEKLRIAIRGISFLPDGSPIVIAYNGNMMFYDSTHKKWNSFIEPGLLRKKFGEEMLPLNLLADDHDIWISTEKNGLIRINIHTHEMIQCREDSSAGSLPTSQLLGLMADPSITGLLWIGSYQGLIVINKNTLRSRIFSLKEGLPDNTI
jgi:WD40 repeat protein